MTRDEVIRLAREAGFILEMWQLSFGCDAVGTLEELERFAALVAAQEREACAKEWGKTFQAAGIGFGIGAQK